MTRGTKRLGLTIKSLRQAVGWAQAGHHVAYVVGSDGFCEWCMCLAMDIARPSVWNTWAYGMSIGEGRLHFLTVDRAVSRLPGWIGPVVLHHKAFASVLNQSKKSDLTAVADRINAQYKPKESM